MKILFVANRVPYPPFRGDKLKIYSLAQQLSKIHELHLVAFAETEKDHSYKKELLVYFKSVHFIDLPKTKSYINVAKGFLFGQKPLQQYYFTSKAMQSCINHLLSSQSFDAIHVQHLRMAQFIPKSIAQITPTILDLPDAFSLYWKRRIAHSSVLKKWFNTIEQKRVSLAEKNYSFYAKVLACSTEDVNWLQQNAHLTNLALLPNGVNTQSFQPKSGNHNYQLQRNILFTGNMDYAPNIDAVVYFVKEIFPLILKSIPQATFTIAGQKPVKQVIALAAPNVFITGFVPNLADEYEKASIVVAPLRFGAGTQNKVLEAMAMGVPVVSHNIGFNGLMINSGEGVLLANDAADFAQQCISLLENTNYRVQIGQKGYSIIQNNFSWEKISAMLNNYFEEITQNKS